MTGLSYEQSKTQMAMWSMFSAPLLMSNNLSAVPKQMKDILQNKHVIAVNQDVFGHMGKRVFNAGGSQVWVKPVSPVVNGHYSVVVVYLNQQTQGVPIY
ncbi:alpha-N-acetylgalactosaminidase-like protein, partial [Leptotrombidium deliense]